MGARLRSAGRVVNAVGPGKARPSDPFGFFTASKPRVGAPNGPSLEDLLRRLLPSAPHEQSPASRLSEMMRQDYAPPAPAIPDYPPLRGFGYRIPIIPPPDRATDHLDTLSGYGSGGQRQLPAASLPGVPPLEPPIDLGPDRPIYRIGPIAPAPTPEAGIVPSATRIGKAAWSAVEALFETPLGISRVSLGSLVAQTPEEARGVAGLIRGFNEMLIVDGSAALDATGRAMLAPIAGGIAAVGQAAQEAGMSRTDARRLERDLHALAVSLGVVTGAAMGGRPGVPRPDRVLAEANARGMLDATVRDLPREAWPAAKQKLRDAFKEGQKVGDEAAKVRQQTDANPKPRATAVEVASKSPLTKLPAESKATNPMTVTQFEALPPSGAIDPNTIRTLQAGVSPEFKRDWKTGRKPSLTETVNQLRQDPNFASELPAIRIFRHGDGVYTLDHRRLVAHRLAEVPVHYRMATAQEIAKEFGKKLDPESGDGLSIRIRGQEVGAE